MLPPEKAFDSGERAINVHTSNLVWVDLPGAPEGEGLQVAYLWGALQPGSANGTFLKIPARGSARILSHAATFRAVVIQGAPVYRTAGDKTLGPGSYFGSSSQAVHEISSSSSEESVLYIRTEGRYEATPR